MDLDPSSLVKVLKWKEKRPKRMHGLKQGPKRAETAKKGDSWTESRIPGRQPAPTCTKAAQEMERVGDEPGQKREDRNKLQTAKPQTHPQFVFKLGAQCCSQCLEMRDSPSARRLSAKKTRNHETAKTLCRLWSGNAFRVSNFGSRSCPMCCLSRL